MTRHKARLSDLIDLTGNPSEPIARKPSLIAPRASLLGLAPELRVQIYKYTIPHIDLRDDGTRSWRISIDKKPLYGRRTRKNKHLFALAQVNHLLRTECLPIVGQRVSFRLTGHGEKKIKPEIVSCLTKVYFDNVRLIWCTLTRLHQLDLVKLPSLKMLIMPVPTHAKEKAQLTRRSSVKDCLGFWDLFLREKNKRNREVLRNLADGNRCFDFILEIWLAYEDGVGGCAKSGVTGFWVLELLTWVGVLLEPKKWKIHQGPLFRLSYFHSVLTY